MNNGIKYRKRIKAYENNKVRKISGLDLFRLNERSYKIFKMNQTIRPEYLMWSLKEITRNRNELLSYSSMFVLEPLMIHNHINTNDAKVHIRCTIYSGAISIGIPLLDVMLDDYISLNTNDDIGKYDPITNGRVKDIIGAKDLFDELRLLKSEQLIEKFSKNTYA